MNNLIYRATRDEVDLAVKLCRRDARDRAGREYAALTLLTSLGLDLAPRPIHIERERYPLPIVVQSWLIGAVHEDPPENDAEWDALLSYFAQLHRITPAQAQNPLEPAVTNIASVAQGRTMIAEQIALLPATARPPDLEELATVVREVDLAEPGGARLTLCRVDANTRNFVRRSQGWASVDWENSGWGEPAFEIVDLMTHPAYASVTNERWDWVVERYAVLSEDPHAPAKIAAFYPLMLAWWVARTARLMYELPRGLDTRLSDSSDWSAGLTIQYQRYLDLAQARLI
jgi:aminoglycoside phosphotransferase (APT) family kinase protein